MRVKKAHVVVAAISLVVIAGTAIALRPKPLVVDAMTIGRGPLETVVDADGRTRVRNRYIVVAPVAGRVERIERKEGTLVRAGEVIARLRALPLDSTTVAQARSRVEAAEALVLEAAAQSRVAAAALDQRRRELSRAERLGEVGGVAPRTIEECQLARLEADEAVRIAGERVHAAEADARQARAVLASQGEGEAAVIPVRAPASGRILRIAERSERIVAAGTPLMEVGDPRSLEVVVDVLSSDAAGIHAGDRVRLTEWGPELDAGEGGTRIGGRVRDVEPSGFTKVSALGVEEQRVNVVIDFDSTPPAVGDGFRVEASIVVWSAADVVNVPRSALIQITEHGSGEWDAFVVRDGRAETRRVRVGHTGGAAAEVIAGINPGDEVILFPSDQLRGGARVKARKS